ncbi:type II toxin-antitoxin system prevent-host-death family antitoxin [Xylanimonas protaetiae]|uniref:Type II toxin-antitoxin system prevent-host-death family antitoxin n=1 Tax=Xylanimonas protaetiae TaxID=2509457 RepID=A0A4P6F531_9MICO|nr:type II toxin-antitoxin system prevent-host-death family antitoxin [Xylanimonas protaetiae]QAY70714.1 type II toxin-antitoxin system prevent-host-death family antitoxin [Xylanimonas protaetiae]
MPLRKKLRRTLRMKVDTRDIRSASHVGRNSGAITDEVEAGRTIVVVKNNRPVGVVAPVSVMEQIDALDEREEDLRLLAMALVRMAAAPDPVLHDWDDVAAELGIDLTDLGDADDEAEA